MALGIFLWLLGFGSANALGQGSDSVTTLCLLGLESGLEDKETAKWVGELISDSLSRRSELELLDLTDVTMGELLLVEGCDSPSPECLSSAVWSEDAGQILYGKLELMGDEILLILRVYIAATGELRPVYSRRFTREDLESALRADLDALLQTRDWTLPAYLSVDTPRLDARVLVDGKDFGVVPLLHADLEPGLHRVRIESEGYVPWEQPVELSRGRMVTLRPTLTPLALQAEALPELSEFSYEAPTLAWVSLGVAGACLSSAAITGGLAWDAKSTFDDERRERVAFELQSRAENLAFATNVLLGIGAVALVTSVLSFVWLGEEASWESSPGSVSRLGVTF